MIGYVTLEEADAYVETHYLEVEDARTNWEDLENESKEILLRRSFEAIDNLVLTGRKTFPDQDTSFPRYPSTEVPARVKYAQIENALSLSDASIQEDTAFYSKLKSFGITSYSIGNLSETFGASSAEADSVNTSLTAKGIVSTKAQQYLLPYIYGGFRI